MQPCPDSDNNLFTVQSKKQTRDRGKCKYDHCSDCEVVLQEKLKGSVSSFVVFCGDLPILFNERSGWLFLHNTWLGLSSCCPSRVVAEHAMDIAAVNISTCSFTLILMLIWMSQCFVKMNLSTIFTWHPEIEELPRRALYATKNRLWLNKAFLPPWMFTAQRLVDDYLRDIVWGFKLIG